MPFLNLDPPILETLVSMNLQNKNCSKRSISNPGTTLVVLSSIMHLKHIQCTYLLQRPTDIAFL